MDQHLFYKVVREDLTHHGFTYTLGINVDTVPFNPTGSCLPGGLYFTTLDILPEFLEYGSQIATIRLCEDSQVYREPFGGKAKADKFEIVSFGPFPSPSEFEFSTTLQDYPHVVLDKYHVWTNYQKLRLFRWSCQEGYAESVAWMTEAFSINRQEALGGYESTFRTACTKGEFRTVEMMVEVLFEEPISAEVPPPPTPVSSSHLGLFETAKWLAEKFAITREDALTCKHDVFRWVCRNGYLTAAKWLSSRYEITSDDKTVSCGSAFRSICVNGHLDTAKWFAETFSMTRENNTEVGEIFRATCRNNQLDVAKWLVEAFAITRCESASLNNDVFRSACSNGRLDMAKWLVNTYEITRDEALNDIIDAFFTSCFNGRLETAKWLAETFEISRDEANSSGYYVLRTTCANGHLETIKWFVNAFSIAKEEVVSDDNYAFIKSCENNHLETAKWLIDTFEIAPEDVFSSKHMKRMANKRVVGHLFCL